MAYPLKSQNTQDISELEAPPPYEYHAPDQGRSFSAIPSHFPDAVGSDSSSLKPIVIPQVTKAFGGAFASPFARAYAPSLERHGISELDFITFIDGLNEAFIANPALQGVGLIGGMLGFVPIGTVQLVSVGVSVASGFVSAGVSYGRAKAFVKDANAKIFLPKGLKVTVKTTKDMMATVNADGGRLQLPPLEEFEATKHEMDAIAANDRLTNQTHPDDPRMRRIRALDGFVEDLTFDVPETESARNWLRRMGEWQANRKAVKQQEKMMKRRSEAHKKLQESSKEAAHEERKADKEIAKVQHEMDKTLEKAERKLLKEEQKNGAVEKGGKESSKKITELEKERSKKMKELEKEMAKAIREKEKKVGEKQSDGSKEIKKADRKEQRVAQKIRWVVIMPSTDDIARDEDVK